MKSRFVAAAIAASIVVITLCSGGICPAAETDAVPESMKWAYLHSPKPHDLPEPAENEVVRVPGSPVAYTGKQLNTSPDAPDWFPSRHPPMPEVVAKSWGDKTMPCADCHWPNGLGHLATATLAGLSANYISEQVEAFRTGRRRPTEMRQGNVRLMIGDAGKVSASQLIDAASYFASLPAELWVRVVEAERVPKTLIDRDGWRDFDPSGGLEPIGTRIVEVAEDERRMNVSDSTSGIVAYVPPGSIQRGEARVRMTNGRTPACTSCHGPELRGVGDVPRLAGQMPTYLARQLWDIKSGSRGGPALAPMRIVVAELKPADIVDIAAYLASCRP